MVLRVMRSGDLAEGQRVSRAVHGRTVTVLRHHGKVHCLDSLCYHMGGPLGDEGDIEDLAIASGACIKCPWHGHRICLTTGGRVELGGAGVSVGKPVQRVHQAFDDGAYIMVAFSTQPLPSDKYNNPCACTDGAEPGSALGARATGYGLGSLGGDTSVAPAAIGWPEPLLPYGGLDKYAPPPSPLKAPRGTLDETLRGRKASAASARGAAARIAVQYRYKPPPMASGAGGAPAAPAGGAGQTTMTDFFVRRQERAGGVADMEV
ncbi:hypothetical protein WJX81_003841 [Elliptochloris bilobata]|uniref:Rieske domain-containing protein n=1 Tax=Elliptochloris bilobata TaxID=381761 RepID=A0AAW1Q9N7_9CHLO